MTTHPATRPIPNVGISPCASGQGLGRDRPTRVFGLIDVASMFVSCERVFRPDLQGRAVVVLSNNDGCAVARSQEAKDAGVVMGAPWYQLRRNPAWLRSRGTALSSNYELYGEMSSRMYATLRTLYSPENLEVYSIDECFVRMPSPTATTQGHQALERVHQWVGLPCSMGIGTTKTLAKVAQRLAKNDPTCGGMVNLAEWADCDLHDALAGIPVCDVWGIGRRLTERLMKLGITSALELSKADPFFIRKKFGVTVERTVRELAGTPCIPLGLEPKAREMIIHIRMLGRTVNTHDQLRDVLTAHTTRAHERLHKYSLDAGVITVSASTSYYRQPFHRHEKALRLAPATNVLATLLDAAHQCLQDIPEGPAYNRAGIVLTDLHPAGQQPGLFDEDPTAAALDTALLDIRNTWGDQSIGYGITGLLTPQDWAMRRELLSGGTGDPTNRTATSHSN